MSNVEFLFDAVICGIMGTTLMSALDWCLSYLIKQKPYVINILGEMLVHEPYRKRSWNIRVMVTGTVAHFLVGIFFAGIYILLWKSGRGNPTMLTGIWWGLLNGLIGILIWRLYFLIHSDPPFVNLLVYLAGILAAHVIFGAGIAICYQYLHGQ